MSATLTENKQQAIERVFQKQRENAPRLARLTYRERRERLDRIDRYLTDEDSLARLYTAMKKDLNKPETEVIASETGIVQSHLNYVRKHMRRWMRPRAISTPLPLIGTRSYVHYEAKGVCLIIAPWNYPLNLALVPLVYAIAAGNAAILKPSEISPHTSAFLSEMIADLFDEEEVAVFEGDAGVAQALLDQPFNHVYFTGSPQIGKIIMRSAAQHLSSMTLELGGKSPAIVDETAAVRTIAHRTAWGKLINSGQTCIAPDYLLLQDSIQENFVHHYQQAVEKMYGAEVRQSPDYCRIISDRHFRRLKGLYEDALSKGAEVLAGGDFDEAARYIAPTLLGNVSEDMEIMQEEIFGPLMPVLIFRDTAEVPAIVNRRPKPLTLYIGSRKQRNINYFIENTSAGGTVINDYMLGYSNPALPFGGVNNSGIGKSFGFHGFVEFSNERSIIHRRWGTLSIIYPPYTDRVKRLLKILFKWV